MVGSEQMPSEASPSENTGNVIKMDMTTNPDNGIVGLFLPNHCCNKLFSKSDHIFNKKLSWERAGSQLISEMKQELFQVI